MKNHTIVQLKAIAKARCIKGYYQLRKAKLINALEATRLVEQNSSIFMNRFSMIPLPFYNQDLGGHQMSQRKLSKIQKISLLRVCKRSKILVIGCWIAYHQNQKLLTKYLSLSKTKLKNLWKERYFLPIERVDICVEKICDTVSNRWIKWIRSRIISA